jgi:uncharacterized protein (TIGR02598 family)
MKAADSRGFSLVEVVIALGIFTFCITILLGLIPVGLKSARSVSEEGNAVHIASSIFGLWQVIPTNFTAPTDRAITITNVFTNIGTVGAAGSTTNYFNDAGIQVGGATNASLAMNYRATSLGATVPGGWEVELRFQWPARASANTNAIQTRTYKEVFVK